jgi:hypothetical protein
MMGCGGIRLMIEGAVYGRAERYYRKQNIMTLLFFYNSPFAGF